MKPCSISQSFATLCGSSPSTSTFAFSSCAICVVSRALSGFSSSAIAGHLSIVALWISGAAL